MNANRQLINLTGLLLVVAILVAGVALIALPMYTESQTIDSSTRSIEQTNSVYEAQITQLSAAEARIDEIDADLAALRAEIPAATRLDDVFEIIAAAADRVDAVVNTIKVGDAEQWVPRAGVGEEEELVATPEPEVDASAEQPASDSETTAATPPTEPDDGPGPQQQLAVTIEVEVDDAKAAMAFVDALGRGKRLLAPIDAKLDDGTLTVTVLTFIRTEE